MLNLVAGLGCFVGLFFNVVAQGSLLWTLGLAFFGALNVLIGMHELKGGR
jgi:hypothetical protein